MIPHDFKGVMAAPNASKITAKVLELVQSAHFSDKWCFKLEIITSQSLQGPDFIRVGQRLKGFTVEPIQDIKAGCIISAEAEFLGDAKTGQLQLKQLFVVPPS